MVDDGRTTTVLEFQRSGGRVTLVTNRRREPADAPGSETGAELRGLLRLLPLLIGAMALEPRPAR